MINTKASLSLQFTVLTHFVQIGCCVSEFAPFHIDLPTHTEINLFPYLSIYSGELMPLSVAVGWFGLAAYVYVR